MTKHKRSNKQLIQFITQYGLHIWAILIIANAALVYSYHFATHASTPTDTKLHILDVTPTDQSPSPSPSTGPLGPSIQLTFTVPGIGSGGGTMKPLTPKRDVTVYLYAPDINSQDPTVKPLYTIKSFALFDANPLSPTYTSFLNPVIDLGSDVQSGNYQIAFRTNLSFRTLIKQNPTDVGGEIYNLNKTSEIEIPSQTVLMGDIVPEQGDNSIDISDYNAFINCFGSRDTTNTFCKGHNYGDFNDDGVIDGIDYNVFLRSLSVLSQEGVAIPTLSPSPIKPKPITKPTKPINPPVTIKKTTITPSQNKSATTSGTTKKSGSLGGIFFLFFLLFLGGTGVFLYLKNEAIRNKINALIHLSPTGTPSPATETPEEQPQEATQPAEEPAIESSEKTATAPAVDGTIEKECYVKVKGPDEAGTGMWLTLADDNGPLDAHYSKNDAAEGFAKAKGVMKTENDKTYFEISELTPEE